ncbi:hypothetical protein NIES4074_34230 [Cylindrospermum sp. NIES-4074]|nr:hypothetical protein NIES4074_34230 [Cylindrospermum sp. NIES-4074]
MLRSTKEISTVKNKQGSYAYGMLTAPVLAIAGLLANILPSMAVTDSYENDYRVCAAQLLSVGITAQAAAPGCATALRPRDLSSCVATIKKKTEIDPNDALSSCRQARRPKELASCVVGISQNTQNAINLDVLRNCGRSLLPVTYAQCVVGLRKEIDLAPTQALATCIDASERASAVLPGVPSGFSPTFETKPIPATPGNQ